MPRAKLIVIDGLDGSGKATQSEILCRKLREEGYAAKTLSFPDYDSDSSAPVRMYLNGELGENPDDVNAYAASSFYAVDRVVSYLNKWKKDYEACDFIIADRYTTSNIIHQMSKIEESERTAFCDWLFDYEYERLRVPAPDLVMFLDVDPDVSQKLLSNRYGGDLSKKDIHESNLRYLLRCRESASWSCEHLHWTVVRCSKDGEMRAIEDIAAEIYGVIKARFCE